MNSLLWTVKNTSSLDLREGLSEADFVKFVAALPAGEFEKWEAKRSDQDRWYGLGSFPAFRLRRFGFGPIPAELKFTSPQLSWIEGQLSPRKVTPPQFNTQRLVATSREPSPADRRKHPRKDIRLQVVIISDVNAFRTFTRNVSLGGMALEKAVPAKLLGAECAIFLSKPGSTEKFTFNGVILAEPGASEAPRHRISFGELSSESQTVLTEWLAEAVSPVRQSGSQAA